MRTMLFALMIPCLLLASGYDRLLIEAQAAMYPKAMILERGYREKAVDGELLIAVLYDNGEREYAELFKQYVEAKHGTGLAGMRLKVVPMSYEAFLQGAQVSAIYGLKAAPEKHRKAIELAKRKKIPAFAYSYGFFAYDYLLALVFRERPVLYMNKKAFELSGLNFHPAFYKVVKIYDQK